MATSTEEPLTSTKRQKTFEEEIREESVFKLMADMAPVMIWVSGLDKGCFFFNEGWLQFRGRTMAQETGNGWAEGVHPEDFDRCLKIYCDSFDQRVPFTMEYRLLRHDGQYKWILDNGVPRFDPSTSTATFLGYIGSCIDITEKKEVEEQLKKARELAEKAIQEKNSLLALVSHQLRIPLNSVIGSVDLMKLNRSADENLRMLEVAARQLTLFTDDIVTATESDSRDVGDHAVSENIHLSTLLQEVLIILKPAAASKRLLLTLDVNLPTKRAWITSDSHRVKQLFLNQLHHAMETTPYGKIRVEASFDEQKVLYTVKASVDLAVPMKHSLHSAPVQSLGLYLVKNMAKSMGGSCLVSAGGIAVEVPFQPGRPMSPTMSAVIPVSVSGVTLNESVASASVLVAEDNLINQQVVVKFLQSAGVKKQIHVANDGEQALQLARQNRFDLILMDCQMPVMDGFTASKEIRSQPGPNQDAPIVALTALAFPEDRSKCLAHGMNGYLSKPFTRDQLLRAIATHVRQWSPGSPREKSTQPQGSDSPVVPHM